MMRKTVLPDQVRELQTQLLPLLTHLEIEGVLRFQDCPWSDQLPEDELCRVISWTDMDPKIGFREQKHRRDLVQMAGRCLGAVSRAGHRDP